MYVSFRSWFDLSWARDSHVDWGAFWSPEDAFNPGNLMLDSFAGICQWIFRSRRQIYMLHQQQPPGGFAVVSTAILLPSPHSHHSAHRDPVSR